MIAVDRGYTLTEHAPTTYNYRYQNTPSPISRTIQLPVDQLNPLSATTTTGSPVFIANLSKDLSFLIDQIGTNTEISAYISRYCTAAYGEGVHFRAVDVYDGSYYGIRIYINGSGVATYDQYSSSPHYLAFVTEAVEMNLRDSYGRPFDPYTRRAKTKFMYQKTVDGQKQIGTFYLGAQSWDYDSIDIEPSSTTITQQDYLYTVTGGVVT